MKNSFAENAYELNEGIINSVGQTRIALEKAESAKHIFISLRNDGALAEAEASDIRRKQGTPLSPYDGIPVAIKDLIDVAGSITTAGSKIRSDLVPAAQDAAVISSLRDVGMIPIGKTNLSEFAYSGLGLNPHYGTPVADHANVSERAPGGSSSGSAMAVKRNIVTAAVGTDTAGSIRVPAAFNGLVGFKASTSRYDMRGVFPLAETMDSLGPIARTVKDCVVLDSAMRGMANPMLWPIALRQLRFVVDSNVMGDSRIEPEVRRNVHDIMSVLGRYGARVEKRPVLTIARARELISCVGWLGAIEAWRHLRDVVEGVDAVRMDQRVRSRLLGGKHFTSAVEAKIRSSRHELMSAISHELQGAILVMPTVFHTAPSLAALEADEEYFANANLDTLALTMVGSLLDMPGVAMPSGVGKHALPTSVLFSAPQGCDDRLLGACMAIEEVVERHFNG
jgi:aspartyl-tRNA(Asn)/glutamyl-tRNA(Gln) amidotransferase subunit A